MTTITPIISADHPVRVPLSNETLGIWGSLRAARRNVLHLNPEIATRVPIISGLTGKRWHMMMSSERCGGFCARMSIITQSRSLPG